ncbi:serine/threonine protein kinase [Sphaerisporangium sp. NBC_01403]|uniref:serine/threonine protein kinase n=1 Tax=Sphaerisporangium sp. NBC_01403 TaxID=2903599 RepID=UPI003256132C
MSNPVPLRPGDPARVGAYELTARLGEGGQGVVYLGRSPAGVTVAVKVLRSDLAQNEEALARFVREVSTAERVATFCTAQVIETGVAGQRPFIVSEYIDGPTLDAVVERDGPRQGAALHRLAIGTVTALVAIHQAGIVHRDFKPSNVLLGTDGPRVIDFGIAKALDKSSTLTSMVVGTPAYMTPEQLAGEQAGPAADLFAWAGTMVFAATGGAPFGTDSLPAVFHRIMSLEPDLSALDDQLRGIVASCLAKDPAARPSAGEVLMRLLGHDTGATPAAAIMAEGSAMAQEEQEPTRRWRADPARGQAQFQAPPPTPQYPGQGYPARPLPGWQEPGPPPPPAWAGDRVTGPGGAGHTSPAGSGGRRGGRVPLITAAVVAGALVVGGGGYLIVRLVTDDPGGGSPNVAASLPAGSSGEPVTGISSPGSTPSTPEVTASAGATTSAASAPPAATRMIDLPGSSITIHESDVDPIKLTFYSLDYGKRAYVRATGKNSFTRTKKYFEYTVSDDGRRAVGTDTLYTRDSYSTVSLVDRASGRSTTIRMAKAPVYPTLPQWSPDGRKVLVSLNEAIGDTSRGYGFAIVDIATRKAKVVHVKEKDVGRWSYFWRGDGRAVGTWALKGKTQRIRFYDANGTVLSTLLDVGTPLTVEGDDVSPSGTQFITTCPGSGDEICVWTTEGEEKARVPFPTDRLIGWYDDRHIAGWRKKGEDYEAVVFDFEGDATRVLATAKAGEYKKQYLRYTRAT